MRKGIIVLLIFMGFAHTLFGQIKIGDNPEIIDPASVLELESSERVLVITRINTDQMNNIAPSQGALVYNTDENCIFYYDGTAWLNLCSGLGLDLTAEAIVNEFPTIVLTKNGPETNIEVGEIRGENIVDFSISAEDIQNNSITADKLATNSVGVDELQDNTVADSEIDYNQVTLADFINDAGYISAADIVSANAGNDIIDNGGAFYDDSTLQNDIAANAAAIAADGDTDSGNEIQDLTLSGTTLGISGGNTVDLSGFNNAGSDDQTLDLTGNVISIEDGNAIDLTPILGTGGTDDQTLDLTGNVISIEDGNSIDLTPILGTGGTDDQQLSLAGNTLTLEDGGTVDLAPYLDNTDEQDLTGATLDAGNILTIDIENGASTTVDLSSLAGAGTDDQEAFEVPFAPTGNTVGTDVQAAIEELQTEIDGISAGAGNPTDELITSFTLGGTALNIAEGANIPPPVDLDPVFATDAELAASDAADLDKDDTNELQDLTSVLAQGADAGGSLISNVLDPVAAQDVATKAYVDASSGGGPNVSADTPNSITTGSDGGALYDDPDADATNEIQDLASVLTQGADAGASLISNVLDPVAAQDVATKAYVDANVGGGPIVSADTPNSITTGSDGGALYDDQDADATNEIQDLTSVLAEGADAGASLISNVLDPVAAQDVATKAYVDANGGGHTGITGSVFFADSATGAPTEDNDSFFWDETARFNSGALYIGVDSNVPSTRAKVHIMEDIDTQLAYPLQLQNDSNLDTGGAGVGLLFSVEGTGNFGKGAIAYERMDTFGRGDFHFLQESSAASTDAELVNAVMTIKNSGNIGIGTTAPNEQLHATGNFELDGALIAQNGAGTNGQVLTSTVTGIEWSSTGGVDTNLGDTDLVQTGGNRTYNLNNQDLAFTGLGNVGIGTSGNPQTKLHVEGLIRGEGIHNSDGLVSEPSYRFTQDTDTGIFRPAADEIAFSTGATEAIRIDGSQNVGIGTTTPTSTLQTGGSFATATLATSGAISLNDSHHTILFIADGSITLPAANTATGRIYVIKNPSFVVGSSNYNDLSGVSQNSIPTGQVVWLQSINGNWEQVK